MVSHYMLLDNDSAKLENATNAVEEKEVILVRYNPRDG